MTDIPVTMVELRYDHDLVLARQRARDVARVLGFGPGDQTRIATAVSEIARNALIYAHGGTVKFAVAETDQRLGLVITVADSGPGIASLDEVLAGRYRSKTGLGKGIVGSRELMDRFVIETGPGRGTVVRMEKELPAGTPVSPADIGRMAADLVSKQPQDVYEELQQQNQELMQAMAELRRRQEEVIAVNKELEETNRGVLALYAELDEKAIELRHADDLKSRYLSEMSHEFRTPLNSIGSLTRMLLSRADGDLTPEQEKQLVFIRKATEQLSDLVNDLLDIAKIEAGKVTVTPGEFFIPDLFSTLRGMLRPLMTNPAVTLVFLDPGDLPAMHTDQGKVSQVLRNLLSNAIKFTEQGEIRAGAAMSADRSSVIFTVSDSGIGIAPGDQPRLFVEFVQLDHRGTTAPKGSGLGLSISRRLARLLGGDLVLSRSVPGEGSTFTATIPFRFPGLPALAAGPLPAREVDPLRFPVLVAGGDAEGVTVYEKFLKDTGFLVVWARTVPVAGDLLRQHRFVAVLLDLPVHGEDARGFLAVLKGGVQGTGTPVIVVSGAGAAEQERLAGADEYWEKPVERKTLIARFRQLAERWQEATVLVIDDDEISRYVIREMLRGTRYPVIEAGSGEKGLALAKSAVPDLIFLDLIMPGMDGFTVLRHLKEDPATRGVPVIVITSKALSGPEREALGRGAVAVFSKEGLSRDAVLAAMRQALIPVGEDTGRVKADAGGGDGHA